MSFWNVQEQEERDYYPQHELQIAYARSRAEFTDDRVKLDELVSQGRFVVVVQSMAYCPSTDAALGLHFRVAADFATRQEAEAHVAQHYAGFEDDEAQVIVFPRS